MPPSLNREGSGEGLLGLLLGGASTTTFPISPSSRLGLSRMVACPKRVIGIRRC